MFHGSFTKTTTPNIHNMYNITQKYSNTHDCYCSQRPQEYNSVINSNEAYISLNSTQQSVLSQVAVHYFSLHFISAMHDAATFLLKCSAKTTCLQMLYGNQPHRLDNTSLP